MVTSRISRVLLTAALALTLPAAAVGQDEEPPPFDLAALAASFAVQQEQIDRLHERLDSIRIGTIRDRIKALEAAVPVLRDQAASSASSGTGSSYDAAERVLVKGIPRAVRSTCRPLRGANLPNGTVAAVQCQPTRGVVDSVAYYLMDYPDAERTFLSVMNRNRVPGPGRRDCSFGRPTQMLLSPYNATGCFVDGGKANVRVVTWAHRFCRQLDVAGTRLREPVIYVALESGRNRIAPLWDFALKPDEDATVDIWRHIPQRGTPIARGCRSLAS